MNNNKNLITHIQTDPNAWKHSAIGAVVSTIVFLVAFLFFTIPASIVLAFTCSLFAGIGIEAVQRITGGQNTTIESIFDTLTTTLWFLYPIVRYREA